ncbi:hypothetical protein QUA46_21430 [Microcoleus sp. MON2_D6]|uniref:hypothetical protein n=1 Tax=unclassified Microcoleus TaxID=2642155 RepID=UPI002FD60AA2
MNQPAQTFTYPVIFLRLGNLEKTLLENLQLLPTEKRQEVLDFVQFLVHQAQVKQSPNESSESNILQTEPSHPKRSFIEFLSCVLESPPILKPFVEITTQEDLTAAQLTEFFVVNSEDFLINSTITRSHEAFLNSYAPEDEGLYDDY